MLSMIMPIQVLESLDDFDCVVLASAAATTYHPRLMSSILNKVS